MVILPQFILPRRHRACGKTGMAATAGSACRGF